MANNNKLQTFGPIRRLIWPIHNFELKKLLPMFAMFFLIAFVYNILHCLKVPLIVRAEGSGAEVIPFLQVAAILPVAVLITFIYTKLINRFNREQVFYIITLGFLSYFAVFLFVLYPHKELLQLDTLANFLQHNYLSGPGSKGLIAAIRHINLTLFYVLSEMWSVTVLFMLFWGFANEVTKVEEAKRFYGIFALGANSSGILSGAFASMVDNVTNVPVLAAYKGSEWLFIQLCAVLAIGVVIVILFRWLNINIFSETISKPSKRKKATAMSLRECFAYLRKSRYVLYIVLMVMGYYVVYNLAEIMWAHKIELVLGTSKEINAYMNGVYSITGVVAVFLALLVSGNVVRRFGWTIAALITPIVWICTSLGFFSGLALEGSTLFDVISTLVSNPANIVLMLGSLQICLGRSCKYTLFDKTKEMAFIPLSKEEQRKSKVIVDGIASRVGKSGGSIIYVMLFYICGGMAHVVPYISIIIFIALAAWLFAIIKMGRIIDKVQANPRNKLAVA